MKKTKKCSIVSCLVTVFMIVCLLTGCMEERMQFSIGKDGTCSYQVKILMLKEVFDKMAGDSDSLGSMIGEGYETGMETISGEQYYTFTRKFGFKSIEELKKFMTEDETYRSIISEGAEDKTVYEEQKAPFSYAEIGQDRFIARLDASSSEGADIGTLEEMMKEEGLSSYTEFIAKTGITVVVSVTLPEVITESNGIHSGNEVTWNMDVIPDDGKFVAVTGNNPVISGDKTAPVIKGIKNKAFYKKAVVVSASDNVSLPKVLIDGKSYNMASFRVSGEGKHTITATDANKNTTKAVFTIDTVKPTVKGAKSGKTYRKKVTLKFSDKNGIQSVKVNGKKCSKKKVTLKKKKKYTVKVTDKAGNTTILKFKIKK